MTKIASEYKDVFKIFKEMEAEIIADSEKSKFPLTFKCIIFKIKTIELILQGLEDCSQNFYSSQILARVLFEHYLIGYYIFAKWWKNRTDEIGEEYYKFYFIAEFFKQETYSIQIENIHKGISARVNLESIKERHPGLEYLTSEFQQEIYSKSKQFMNIKQIGEYLKKQNFEKPEIQLYHDMMLEFLDKFNVLSSFVHGGPTAEQFTFYPTNDVKNYNISSPTENIEWAQIASKTLKVFIIFGLLIEYPSRYLLVAEKVMKVQSKLPIKPNKK